MAGIDLTPPPRFSPDAADVTGERWTAWKERFNFYLLAKDLTRAAGERKVAILLTCMGEEAMKLYGTFTFTPAVAANPDEGIEAVQGENRNDLETVLRKFDQHYGNKKYRNVRRQAFLNRKQGKDESIMDFIADLKHKINDCEYGEAANSILCDRIVQGIKNNHVKTRLLDLPDDELTVENAIKICRASELTSEQVRALGETEVKHARTFNGNRRGRGRAATWQRERSETHCDRCGRTHERYKCPAYNKFCGSCGQRGHFARSTICQARPQGHQPTRSRGGHRGGNRGRQTPGNPRGGRGRHQRRRVHHAGTENDDDSSYYYRDNGYDDEYQYGDEYQYDDEYQYYDDDVLYNKQSESQMDNFAEMFNDVSVLACHTNDDADNDWFVDLSVCEQKVKFEIDTGARCNIMSQNTVHDLRLEQNIKPSHLKVSGIYGQVNKVKGTVVVPCIYKGEQKMLEFVILEGNRNLNLLGRKDSVEMNLIARVNVASCNNSSRSLIESFNDVFGDVIGCVPGEYDIKIDESVKPAVHAPRSVPAPIRDQVKKELDTMEKMGIIEKVTAPTEWVNSMVAVRKSNGRVRICIDPTDLNKAILREHYPMNSIEDISTRLHNSKFYTVLDANMGYFQVKLSKKSSELTTFNTPFGRYKYLRLPMGIKSSSDVFQRKMIEAFGDIDGVEVVVDDILIHGSTIEQHNDRLKKVLQRAREIDLKFNSKKCKIAVPEVTYVGHKLSREGLQPTDERIKAITEMKRPENKAELETVMGMIAYVAKFIPNLSDLNAPLRHLKRQDSEWKWGKEEDEAYEKIKKTLISGPLLKFYDKTKPILISVDASMKGLGAAAIQDNGVIAYASRALTPTEQRYAQIEKEMLAVVFGCLKFHKLIYGKSNVTIESDHKPLESLVKKPIHASPMRIQKMMLKLQPYEFKLVYTSGKNIGLADALSRFPRTGESKALIDDDLMVCIAETVTHGNHEEIAKQTAMDDDFQTLMNVIKTGWPEERSLIPPSTQPYWNYRGELSVYNGVIYRGERVCVPRALRPKMLKIIHSSHTGMVKCKQRARDLVFWPNMNKQIEEMVSTCEACLEHRAKPPREPMVIPPVPSLPWSKVGTDIFQLGRKSYLVLVDYYSNFFEIAHLTETTSSEVIKHIKQNIARYGIVSTLISDNGPQFTSKEFKDFSRAYGFNHITSSPRHQQSNGLAENAVKIAKLMLKKCIETREDPYLALLDIRNTPRDSEIGSPAQRLMGRRTRTRLPTSEKLLQPEGKNAVTVQRQLQAYREKQKKYYDRGTKERPEIKKSDAIRTLTSQGWQPAELIAKHDAPNSYIIKAGDQAKMFRKNSKELMVTKEKPHKIIPKPEPPLTVKPPPQAKRTEENSAKAPPREVQTNRDTLQQGNQRTRRPVQQHNHHIPTKTSRYGRKIKSPTYLKDYAQK